MMGKGGTAQLEPEDLVFLEKRGAVARRGRGTFSRSAVLRRELQLLRALLRHYDPLKAAGLPREVHDLAVRLLPEPWTLTKPVELRNLADLLAHVPELEAELAAAGLEREAFLAAIAGLGFAEKVALLDHALLLQAPDAAAAEQEEP
jgi:hypothetical protein